MNRRRLLKRLTEGALQNVSFDDLLNLAEGFGFRLQRVSGSHHILAHPDIGELVNLQRLRERGEARSDQAASAAGGAVQSRVGGLGVADYHINIFCSEEDGGYIADIPDLESCSAFGGTAKQALAEVERAKKAWIEAARAAGKPIPPPRYRPAIYQAVE